MSSSKDKPRPRGRPPVPGRKILVKLPDELIEKARALGGSVSAGIRKALERARLA